jgi:hypothetical protein
MRQKRILGKRELQGREPIFCARLPLKSLLISKFPIVSSQHTVAFKSGPMEMRVFEKEGGEREGRKEEGRKKGRKEI